MNSIYRLIDNIYDHFSNLDIIINSASQFYPKSFEELTVTDWENNIDLHTKHLFGPSVDEKEACNWTSD